MRKTLQKRIRKVEDHYASVPIPPRVVSEAFQHFRETGALPEDQTIAYLVMRRAQAGYDCTFDKHDKFDMARSIRAAVEAMKRPEDKTMDELYMEAVFGEGIVQVAARSALKMLAEIGLDPSEPLFAGRDVKLPNWGGVGIHLVGLPSMLVHPPYEEQAERLLARFDALRDRIPNDDRAWFDRAAQAIGDFMAHGRLSDDELLRDCVLADGEARLLMRSLGGDDVSEPMAVFDAMARSDGDTKAVALQQLLSMAAQGQLSAPGQGG